MARISAPSKPRTKVAIPTSPTPTSTDISFSPKVACTGATPSIAPRTVSPNNPPRPNECDQSIPGTSVEA